MDKITLTQEQLEKIVRMAFRHGESWGVCYQGWFTPSEKDTDKHIQICLNKIKRKVKKLSQ